MNAGAALVTNITSTYPIIVTAPLHNFLNGTIVSIEVPVVDGLQQPGIDSWLARPQFFTGAITVIDANTFSMVISALGLSAFGGPVAVYVVPVTYSCSAYPTTGLTYYPAYRLITAITNAFIATVTTSFAHGYMNGLVVRIVVPYGCGMYQINGQTGTIIVTGANTFTIPINTTHFDPFVIPLPSESSNPHVNICALTVPIGEDSSILYQATVNVL